MTRSRSRFGRFRDNMRRNVLSYKYIKHNILMTGLVVLMALGVFAIVNFGEEADPLADELYESDAVTVDRSQAVMMDEDSVKLAMDAANPSDSYMTANNTVSVASSGTDTYDSSAADESSAAETVTTEQTAVTADTDAAYEAVTEADTAEDEAADTVEASVAVADSQATDLTGTVLYDGVCIQAEQSADSTVLAMVNSGDAVSILVQDEGWMRVKTADGTTGYIGTEFVSVQ